ncbi:MAG: hypothetical protein Q4F66_07065 [Clostridium sp.]|nr:hypothetical protein [Clostridium sp.]
MKLKEIFDTYVDLNGQYVSYVNEIINKDFEGYSKEDTMDKLIKAKNKFQELMNAVDEIQVEEEDGLFLKDVKYGIVDGLFLAIDLYNFYHSEQLERFKMRGVNYIRKGRVTSFF